MANVVSIDRPCGRKILYFCPDAVMRNVEREWRHWTRNKRSVVILGGQSKATRKFLLENMREHPEYVVILNYAAWRKDLSLLDDLIDIEFDTAIIDEAHNIKDTKSIAYRGIHRVLHDEYENPRIPFIFPMTGTPVLNKPEELFPLLHLVDPKHFKKLEYFLYDFCEKNYDTNKWHFTPTGLDGLAKKISNIYLRRTKEQAGIVLPPKTVQVHSIPVDELTYPKQAYARKQMRQWGSIMLDPDQGKAVVAQAQIAVYTRLRQIEVWPAGVSVKNPLTKEVMVELGEEYAESQKLDYIIHANGSGDVPSWGDAGGLLPEIVYNRTTGEGERVVIFSQFKDPLREIKRRCDLAGIKAVVLDGETPQNLRDEIAMDFDTKHTPDKANSKWDVVLCNYKVGGVGLNFTGASQMIVVDEEWNPGKRDQAYDRIHRMGQEVPVTIHVLRDELTVLDPKTQKPTAGGIDIWLSALIDEKEAMVGGFNLATDMAQAGFEALKSGLI